MTLLPSAELVVWVSARGEWHALLSLYDREGRTLASFEHSLGDRARAARAKAALIAKSLGLSRVSSNGNLYRRLVPAAEF